MLIEQEDDVDRSPFPSETRIGEAPAGFVTRQALASPLEPAVAYKIGFSSGEAYYEALVFKPNELGEDVLTFDRQVMTPEQFSHQGCE